ncbi:hypothetical protein RJ641_015549 [Dillenia turbinata]|uniref:C2H2-type domain-containing protein n=1 Tax=Dillenia turbinata TaxID=194707 RepID=A0AAN8UPU3_9MAGN
MLVKMTEETISNNLIPNPNSGSNPPPIKRKRNLPGTPDPEAEVIALSPKTLMATNRFLCEICGKGFQRDQNLQLHRRGHNLPWKLKQRTGKEPKKRVYVCPEKSCVHNHPSRALGDLTGIKKHFSRKHGEKKWKCEKCSKRYAVQSDWKAHSKTCGTREYKCDCGTLFSRRDSFITHRAFCDALAEETARITAAASINNVTAGNLNYHFMGNPLVPNMSQHFSSLFKPISGNDQVIDQSRHGLSLWMGQTSQGHGSVGSTISLHELHQISSSGVIYNDPLLSCLNPPPSDYQLNWVFGSKISSNNGEELSSTLSQHESAPSLYSTQRTNTTTHQTPSMNMSATALLQKAAQIGPTSTGPTFSGSFVLKCNNTDQVQDGNRICGLYGTTTTNTPPSSILGGGTENNNSTMNDLSSLNQLQMHPAKRQKISLSEDNGGGGQTRDFLGVGVQPICHPSSINGWI